MVIHKIILSSSYSTGTRIGLHYVNTNIEEIEKDINTIKSVGKDITFSIHTIITEDITWKSVILKDSFFKDIKVCDLQQFINLIKMDRNLSGLEVAHYILSKVSCSYQKLQKLVYLSFIEYWISSNKELFKDDFLQLENTLVSETVYNRYKDNKQIITLNKVDNLELTYIMKTRIAFAEDGSNKLIAIDNVINEYGTKSDDVLLEVIKYKNDNWNIRGQIKV